MQSSFTINRTVRRKIQKALDSSVEHGKTCDDVIRRTQRRSFVKRTDAEESFWLTLRLRILTNMTANSLHNFVKNYNIVYENRSYYKRFMQWKSLKGFLHTEMTYSKSLLESIGKRPTRTNTMRKKQKERDQRIDKVTKTETMKQNNKMERKRRQEIEWRSKEGNNLMRFFTPLNEK